MKWDKLPQRFFSGDFMDALYQRYNVDGPIQELLCDRLEQSAREWFYSRNAGDADASPREVRETINKIAQTSSVLQELLSNTPAAAWSALTEASKAMNSSSFNLGVHYGSHHYPEVGLIGTPAITIMTDDETEPFQTIKASSLIAALNELSSSAEVAAQIILTVKQGPQPELPLKAWVLNMRNLWYKPLDRPFTLDATGSEPISEAACFCVEIYAHLAPETPKSRVLNEVKNASPRIRHCS